MASQVDSLTITALNHVPANPAGPVSGECMFVVAEPVTPQGRGIASLGWGVTAEVAVGALGFVSFAGKAEVGSSGSCYITEGNIGIFRGGPLQGLIYAAPGAKRGIGRVTVIEGGLRVWDGDYPELPLADLRLHGDDRVVVSAVASRDRFCDGAVSLPNIYGLPIHLARRLVLAEGWVPVSADPDTPFLMPELPESQGCAATGFGICSFDYRAPNGLVLSVVTAGDPGPPSSLAIVTYDVACRPLADGN